MIDKTSDEPTEQNKMYGGLSQEETGYVTLSANPSKACANCRWFRPNAMEWEGDTPHDACHLVDCWPEPILPTGYCERHEMKPAPDEPEPMEVVIVDTEKEQAIFERVWKRIQDSAVYRSVFPQPRSQDSAFRVLKGQDGQTYWLATYTNDFEDLENEILSRKGHDAFITRTDLGIVPMPELWAWHTPGTKHGEALAIWRNGHFIHALGVFDDTPEAQHAAKAYQKIPPKLSHGFTAPEWAFKDGVYESFNTFEISTLPDGAEANPFVQWEELDTMPTPALKRPFLRETLGWSDADIDAFDAKQEERGKALEAAQLRYKDFADTTEGTETPAAESNPAISQLLTDLIEGQGQLADLLVAQENHSRQRETEWTKERAALQTELAALKSLVNTGTRRAETSAETVVTAEAVAVAKAKTDDDTRQLESQWGVKMKPAGAS